MLKSVEVAVIGAGTIAARHVRVLSRINNVRVTSVTDLEYDRAADLAQHVGAGVYTSYHEMLDETQPDAAYVLLPPFAHGAVEQELITRGIPFFVEKPLGVSNHTVSELAASVAATDLITAVGYQWRYLDVVERLTSHLEVNRPLLALGYWADATPPPYWWIKQDLSGGQMLEQTTHIFDLARYLLGEVAQVYAAMSYTRREQYPEADIAAVSLASLRFRSGTIANISSTCTLNSPHRIGLDLYCEGVVYECHQSKIAVHRGDGQVEEWHASIDPLWEEDCAFIHAVATRDRAKIRCDYVEGLRTHELVSACMQSAREERAISLVSG